MKNIDIRNLIAQKRLKHYEVAEALNIDDCTLSRWLSHELIEDKKQKIIAIIGELSGSNYDGYEERVFRHMEVMNDSQKQNLLACAEQILLKESEE